MSSTFDHAFFYDSNDGDRKYNAESFEYWLKKFFTTGVFSGDLKVMANGGMSVAVSSGYCNIEGKVRVFKNDTILTLDTAGAVYDRIDSIVIERNDTERDITIKIVKGTEKDSPIPAALVRTSGIYQLVIARVVVKAGKVEITQSDITDTREYRSLCGVVTGTVEELDFSQLKAQFDDFYDQCGIKFEQWLKELDGQLGTDAAGKLLHLIEVERARINALASLKDGSTTGDAELQDIRIGANGKIYESAGEAVRSQFRDSTKEYEFIPVTLDDIDTQHINAYFTVKGAGNLTVDAISMATLEGYCTHAAKVSKGDCLLLTNAHNLTSKTPYLMVFDNDGKCVDQVSFDYLKDAKYYDKRYVFAEDGFFYICFDYTTIQSGEFFYIKRTHRKEPFVLYAEKAESYVDDADTGEAVMKAIMEGRQIVVRVPNADGGNYMALYSPVLMYQLPNYLARHLYLFYLNDGVNEMGLPGYSQLKIAVSRDYNQTPLF